MFSTQKFESSIIQKIRLYWELTLNRVEPLDHWQRRYQRIAQSMLAAFASKGVALLVNFISVPLTINYLGAERYGVWVTLSTLLAWLQIADLGLGNGLTNAIANAYGQEDRRAAQRAVATTFWLLSSISVGIGILATSTWSFIHWQALFNVQSSAVAAEISMATAAAISFALLNIPLTCVDKVLGGYQKSAIAHYWTAIANIASLLAILLVTELEGGLLWLVVGYSGATVVVKASSAVWLFARAMPWLRPTLASVKRSEINKLARTGGIFFMIQIAVLLVTQTDNLIITHYLGAGHVAPYNVTWRLFMYATMPQMMVASALWPAYTEAFARKDGKWIRRAFQINLIGSLTISTLFSVILVLFGQLIIDWWAGPLAIPPTALLGWMGVWSVISTTMSVIACILNASGQIRGQMIYGLLTAITNLWLSTLWVIPYGITGVIAATVIAYTLFNALPAIIETRLIIRKVGNA